MTVNYELFTDFDADYILNMTRDLTKTNKVGNLNIGVESSRNQDVTLEYVPQFMKFFNFNTKYKTIYKQNRRENLQNDSLSIQYEVENEKTTSANVTLKFSKWGKDIMELIDIEEVVEKDGKEEIIEEEEEKEEEIPEIDERELEDIERKKQMENEDPELGKQNELIDSVQVEKIEEEITEKDDGRAAFNFKKMVMYVTKVVGYSVKMLGNADFSYTNTYKTKYFAPPDSLPGIYYQLGLRDQTAGSIQSTGQSDAFSVNTRTTFEVFSFLSADLNAKYTIDLTKASGNKTKSESIVLPGVMLSFNSIDKLLKAKFMTGSNLSTSFTRLISNTGQGFWETPEQTTEKYQFTPLLSFNTKLLNKINTNLGFNYTFSDQKSYTGNFKQTHTNEMGLSMTFRYSFQAAKGIKIPLLGRLKMNNKTDIDLNVSYTSNRSQYTDTSNQQWQDANHKNVLKIEPRIAYNFSRDINAGLTARYESSKDVKAETSSTTTAINIWVEFKF